MCNIYLFPFKRHVTLWMCHLTLGVTDLEKHLSLSLSLPLPHPCNPSLQSSGSAKSFVRVFISDIMEVLIKIPKTGYYR